MTTSATKNYQTFPYFNIKRVIKMAIILAALAVFCLFIPEDLVKDEVSGRSITYVRTSIFLVIASAVLLKTLIYNLDYIRRIRKLGMASSNTSMNSGWLVAPYEKELKDYNVSYPMKTGQTLHEMSRVFLWIIVTIVVVMVSLGKLASN